jgi:hypothetical protein
VDFFAGPSEVVSVGTGARVNRGLADEVGSDAPGFGAVAWACRDEDAVADSASRTREIVSEGDDVSEDGALEGLSEAELKIELETGI